MRGKISPNIRKRARRRPTSPYQASSLPEHRGARVELHRARPHLQPHRESKIEGSVVVQADLQLLGPPVGGHESAARPGSGCRLRAPACGPSARIWRLASVELLSHFLDGRLGLVELRSASSSGWSLGCGVVGSNASALRSRRPRRRWPSPQAPVGPRRGGDQSQPSRCTPALRIQAHPARCGSGPSLRSSPHHNSPVCV